MITNFPCRCCRRVTLWHHQGDPRVSTESPPFMCSECASLPSSFSFVGGAVCYAGVPEANGRSATFVPLELFLSTCDMSN